MDAPGSVLELVERFQSNYDAYTSSRYNETQLRREFLDPLFKGLGWDIDNERGYAEAYKDVVHEDAIKIGEATKAPDYCFRIGGARKFFVEAKRPAIDIKHDVTPAFQLRRYAWTTKLSLSVLTDFEEFAVYDCRIKPDKSDAASVARILYIPYTEYASRWNELADVFSRGAVLKGSFDKFAESTKVKRGTADVDDSFLATIEEWRLRLASNLALRNAKLTQSETNFAVQRIIDRIIFLRICEGRGIEDYGRLRALTTGDHIYPRLVELFEHADGRYNSGLFAFKAAKDFHEEPDKLTPSLHVDDKLVRDILNSLYYPESPYVFSALPSDVLGQVYEQFLGKVIRLTDSHRAVVEEKPEVKRAGGVYYTPTYIVHYIVQRTLGILLENQTPTMRRKCRVLDPACGSGSFLLGAYEYLLKWHLDFYTSNKPDRWSRGARPTLVETSAGWKLTIGERKRILLDHIFGVDIDSQAVETTKLALLLKVLEGETQQTLQPVLRVFEERALPDLGCNIKCGNSLIDTDYYRQTTIPVGQEDEQKINAFDWHDEFPEAFGTGGFDVVIGNPPYDVMEKERGAASWPHEALADYARGREEYTAALGGKLNLFRFFIVRALSLTTRGGRFGMIVPLALLADISCAQTRRHLILNTRGLEADCFPQKDNANRRVFKKAKLSTVVITASSSGPVREADAEFRVRVYPWNRFEDSPRQCSIRYADMALLDREHLPVPLVSESQWLLCRKLHRHDRVRPLGDIEDFEVNRGEINQTIYRRFIGDDSRLARMLKGVEIGQYRLHAEPKQGGREWFDERAFLRAHEPKPIVSMRRIASQRITGVDERLRIVATIVEPPMYFADSTNSVVARGQARHSLEYLLALLNSRLFQWRFKLTSTNNNVGTNELETMPFRAIDFSDGADHSKYDGLVRHVAEIMERSSRLERASTPAQTRSLERSVEAIDDELNRLVYELYDLTAEEIALVESTNDTQSSVATKSEAASA